MYEWVTFFHTNHNAEALPFLRNVAVGCENSSDYFFRGIERSKDQYCAFQHTLSGEGFFKHKNRTYQLKAGDSVLFRVSDPDISYGFPEGAKTPWRFIYTDIYRFTPHVQELTQKYGPVFRLPENSHVLRRLFNFQSEGITVQTIDYFYGAKIAMDLLFELALCSQEENLPQKNELVRHIDQYIYKTMYNGVSIQDLAKSLGLTREHISREFKKLTGVTLHFYINRKRMLHACELLINTSLSCKEIAYKLADPSPAHFSNAFKKFMGQSPNTFRQQHQQPHRI